MTKITITLPLKFWDRLRDIQKEQEGTLSDAVYSVVDLGFQCLDRGDVPEEAEEDEEEEEEAEEEEDEEDES